MFASALKLKPTENTVSYIDIRLIDPCPYQPRKTLNIKALEDLTENIKENGILQPLTATLKNDGRYQLIAGHRRLLAAKKAGLNSVPVIVMDKKEEEIAVLAVVENLQREDLNFFEQAAAIQRLMDNLNLTQRQVGQKLSLSQPAVANKLKLLQFTGRQQSKILSAALTERHTRAVSRLPATMQDKALDHIIKNNLNVNVTDKYIAGIISPKKKQNIKISIRDIRVFTNTINKAVKLIKSAGINADYTRHEEENFIHYSIVVPKIFSGK